MNRPLITPPDLARLFSEALLRNSGDEFDRWAEREDFDPQALVGITRVLADSWKDSDEPIEVLALFAFSVGWDAHRDLRGERDA